MQHLHWQVNQWLKKAVLLSFRLNDMSAQSGGPQGTSWWDKVPFDAVLLDLPCSATGVIRRKPDVRLMRSEATLKSLLGMQAMILDATWRTLRVGGRFLVTTCSVLPQENQDQIRKFLDRHPDAALVQINGAPGIDTKFGIQHFPIHTGGDGFFYALLVKSKPINGGVSA
jgi:16S rRNA (cytosine967-C5)-methyltransferase